MQLQGRMFVGLTIGTRRWKALGVYFRAMRTSKYVHTSGTENIENYDFWHVHMMCMMCADTFGALATSKTV